MGSVNKRIRRRPWTAEDEARLTNGWGHVSITRLARSLDRTEEAVKHRALRLGLGPYVDASDLMTVSALASAITGTDAHGSANRLRLQWTRLGLPVHRCTIARRRLWMVNVDEFWEWLDGHRAAVSLAKLEPGALGREPAWVAAKRRADAQAPRCSYRAWTTAEDDKLRALLLEGVDMDTMAARLGRTTASVNSRMAALGTWRRPPKAARREWTAAEDAALHRALVEGLDLAQVAVQLGRSREACQGRCRRLWGTVNRLKLQARLR